MMNLLIIGAGGIGSRHLQGCATLDPSCYRIDVVEPDGENWTRAKELFHAGTSARSDAARPGVNRFKALSELPALVYELAIVATLSDVRSAIVRDLLSTRAVKRLVLEKVLFQRLSDYREIRDVLAQKRVDAWVNCPRRLWSAYERLRARCGDAIGSMHVHGSGLDLGCNGIHFIDLFEYLSGCKLASCSGVELSPPPRPAKRAGMLHISGQVQGRLQSASGRTVSFTLHGEESDEPSNILRLESATGTIARVTETPGRCLVQALAAGEIVDVEDEMVPFQSGLTARVVEEIIRSGSSGLVDYAESMTQHLVFLGALNQALHRNGWTDSPAVCPVS